jgi:acid phosphatase family membrane protein YuiD
MIHDWMCNRVFWIGFLGWLAAQLSKVVLNLVRGEKFHIRWLIETGGMPSSHSGGVSALTTAIGLYEGFGSTAFALSFTLATVVMFDAQTSRRCIGKQAVVLNAIIDDVYAGKAIAHEKVRAFMGHTPFQVFIGMLIGIGVAVGLHHVWR